MVSIGWEDIDGASLRVESNAACFVFVHVSSGITQDRMWRLQEVRSNGELVCHCARDGVQSGLFAL